MCFNLLCPILWALWEKPRIWKCVSRHNPSYSLIGVTVLPALFCKASFSQKLFNISLEEGNQCFHIHKLCTLAKELLLLNGIWFSSFGNFILKFTSLTIQFSQCCWETFLLYIFTSTFNTCWQHNRALLPMSPVYHFYCSLAIKMIIHSLVPLWLKWRPASKFTTPLLQHGCYIRFLALHLMDIHVSDLTLLNLVLFTPL